jgi:hypothetical protein
MANTAGFYPDQDFIDSWPRLADFLQRERLLEFAQDGSLHAFNSCFQE